MVLKAHLQTKLKLEEQKEKEAELKEQGIVTKKPVVTGTEKLFLRKNQGVLSEAHQKLIANEEEDDDDIFTDHQSFFLWPRRGLGEKKRLL